MQYTTIPQYNPNNYSQFYVTTDGDEQRVYRFLTVVEYACSLAEKRGSEPNFILLQRMRYEPSTNTNVDDDSFPPVEWDIDYFEQQFIPIERFINE